jgi:hypothetical protein
VYWQVKETDWLKKKKKKKRLGMDSKEYVA